MKGKHANKKTEREKNMWTRDGKERKTFAIIMNDNILFSHSKCYNVTQKGRDMCDA